MSRAVHQSGLGLAIFVGIGWSLAGGVARAQEPSKGGEGSDASRIRELLLGGSKDPAPPGLALPPGMPEVHTDCGGADAFGGSAVERGAWCLAQESKYVGVRTLADRALLDDERSFRAHYLMGVAQHLGEGNLPKALFHLQRAEQLFVEAHGEIPAMGTSPWNVYHRTLLELVYVHGEMDHHEEKIRYVDAIESRLGLDYRALKAWPLLKLKRFEEARLLAREAIDRSTEEDRYRRDIGLTALCAIESEMRHRDEAYQACKAAAAPVLKGSNEGGVALTNAGAASMEVFRFDEAERLYTEATRRDVEGTINPWGRLLHLYLRQGRFAEAVSAWREMQKYRMRRPPYFDQQDQADADLAGAAVLIISGRTQDALRITERTVNRPDRQGTSSADFEQNETGNLVLDRMVRLDVARRLEEEASWSKLGEALKLRAKAVKLRLEAWANGRRAATVLSDRERLVTTLRPECPGSIELPSWLDGEVIAIVGAGVSMAAVEAARKDETLPAEKAEPIFRAFEAEAHLLEGDHARALEDAWFVVEQLPQGEVLLRARAAAIGARAAAELGQPERALGLYQRVLSADPGLFRRLGHTLPIQLSPAGDSPAIARAIEHLGDSPLFASTDWGFKLVVGEDALVLLSADGSELARARVPAGGPQRDDEALARRIAKTAHQDLLVPNVDVTQADIHSLDGGLTGGGRANERTKSILEEVLKGP